MGTEPERPPRTIFDGVADLYDEVRPDYPDALFDDLFAWADPPPGGRILEIGSGTGKATLPLARRGLPILGLELGEQLAAVARARVKDHPQVEIRTCSFEDWPEEPEAFDLVTAAQSFHWIDPGVGYPKVARALRPGGAAALFWNMHPGPHEEAFFVTVQEVYRREAPALADSFRTRKTRYPEVVDVRRAEIEATGLFGEVAVRHHPWEATYTRDEYLKLLQTYSDHRQLPEETRARLLAGIGEVIDGRFGGKVTKPYVAVLFLARR